MEIRRYEIPKEYFDELKEKEEADRQLMREAFKRLERRDIFMKRTYSQVVECVDERAKWFMEIHPEVTYKQAVLEVLKDKDLGEAYIRANPEK